MSLDVDVRPPRCPHCDHAPTGISENITYNVAPIYYPVMRAIGVRGGLRGLDGRRVGDVDADGALDFLRRHEARLREREPESGWGGVRCVYRVLRMLSKAAADMPDAIVEVS